MFMALLVLGSVALVPVAMLGSLLADAGMSGGGAGMLGVLGTVALVWAAVKK